jgi:hypothetical protein
MIGWLMKEQHRHCPFRISVYEQYLIKVIFTIALVTLWMGEMCIKNINRDVRIQECGKDSLVFAQPGKNP